MFYVVRPLTPEARARLTGVEPQRSPFSSSWSSTLEVLRREVEAIVPMRREGGELVYTKPVLMVDVTEGQLRLDGGMRADARPASPAVGLSVESKHGALLFATDRFRSWQDNVRAIALGLEALRRVERYGIVQTDEQYRGWQALPPGTPMPAAQMTAEQAARRMCELSGLVTPEHADVDRLLAKAELVQLTYRTAARRCHPDAASGSTELFQELEECYRIVKAAQS